jgi:hypothetical protein
MKKSMKFLCMAACIAMAATVVGCAKDNEQAAEPEKVVTSTATISLSEGDASKQIDEHGVKNFVAGEKIAVVYKNTSNEDVRAEVTLNSGDITNAGKTATITVTMTNPAENGALKIIYPAAMAKADGAVNYDALYSSQDGTLATLSSTYDFSMLEGTLDGTNLPSDPVLTNQLAVCKFIVKESGTDITGDVRQLTVKNGSDTYVITRTPAAGPVYVAVKPVTTGNIELCAAKGKDLYTKTVTGKTLVEGHLYPINVTMTQKSGALSGLFTVNASGKHVHFSKGNLMYDGSNWSFHTNQYDRVFNSEGTATGYPMDHFTWGNQATTTYDGTGYVSGTSNLSGSTDWGSNMGDGWYTMTIDEWQYLIANHTVAFATVNGIVGLILLPDGYAGTAINNEDFYIIDVPTWTSYEAAGAVFLPFLGTREGSEIIEPDGGVMYWSSSAVNANRSWAFSFDGTSIVVDLQLLRTIGSPVRLVCE